MNWAVRILQGLVGIGSLILVMAGTVVTHLLAGQGLGVAVMPLVLLMLSLIVFLGQRKIVKAKTA
ncbi:hypothetical protein D3C73_794850 [compost metagenome]